MEQAKRYKGIGISGSTLKMIAIVAMLIDHTAAAILERILILDGIQEANSSIETAKQFIEEHRMLYVTDLIMRMIGRVSFPIFCFLLIEGFLYTRNLKKYIGRMFVFALLSEIPFDLAFHGKLSNFGYQNVFLTLALGLLVLAGFRIIEQKEEIKGYMIALCYGVILAMGMGIAYLIKSDYGAFGIFAIAAMYQLRRNRIWEGFIGCAILTIMSLGEVTSFLMLLPLHFYNGKRGLKMKYFFYVFYPMHLLILYAICKLMGIADIAVI